MRREVVVNVLLGVLILALAIGGVFAGRSQAPPVAPMGPVASASEEPSAAPSLAAPAPPVATQPLELTAYGGWADRSALVRSIPRPGFNPDYQLRGSTLLELPGEKALSVEFNDRHEGVASLADIAQRQGALSPQEATSTAAHTLSVTLVERRPGSVAVARGLLRFAGALVRAGATAVRVEASGAMHGAERWSGFLARKPDANTLLDAFVVFVVSDSAAGPSSEHYTCGMHVFGLPDVSVPGSVSKAQAARLLWTFAGYLIRKTPTLTTGDAYSTSADAPAFRLRHAPCERFAEKHTYHNPFGVWHLTPGE